MVTRQEVRFDQLTQYGTPVPADAEVLVTVGDVQYRVAISQLPRGTDVEANPTDPATDTLTTIEIEGVVYSLSVTPADDSITPAMLDAGTTAKKLAMRSRIGAGTLEEADIAGLQLMQFAGLDADVVPTLEDGEIGLYVGSTQIVNGDIAQATIIYVADGMVTHGQNPLDPNVDEDAYTLPGLKSTSYAITLTAQGQNASVLFFTGIPTRVTNGWRLPVVSVWGSYTPPSAGIGWNVAMLAAYVPSVAQHRAALPDGEDNAPAQTTTFLTGTFKKLSVTAFVTLLEGLSSTLLGRLRRLVQGNNESISFTVTRVTGNPTQAGEVGLDNLMNGVGQILLWPPATDGDNVPLSVTDLREYQSGDFLDLGSLQWEFGATPWNTFSGSILQASVDLADDYTYQASDLPAVNATATMTLDGRDIHLGRVVRQILKKAVSNIAGKGGTQGQFWKRGTSNTNAGWGTVNYSEVDGAPDVSRWDEWAASFYDGWTTLNNATYSSAADIVANLPVDVSSDSNATVPTANQRVILRPNNTTWTDGPAGIVWALDFLQGATRYCFGITAGGAEQQLYRRDGSNWISEDIFTNGIPAALYGHFFNTLDGDIIMRIDDGQGEDVWDLPGATGDPFLYRAQGRDIAAISPNYGGGNLVNYSWNRFDLDADDVDVDASGFNKNLATTDTDMQKVAQKVNDLTVVKGWQGVRRRLGAKLTDSIAASDTWNNLFTVSVTPDAVGQKLRLRYHILMSREQGQSNLLGLAARKVIGSWDGGIFDNTAETRDFTPLELRQWAQSNAWLDWLIEAWNGEYEFTAESTDTVKINIGAFTLQQADPVTRENGTLYINRAQNLPASNWPGADSNYYSWVELTKFADGNEDITETSITALDSA